ncbi:MAG TPA: hypothetical protein VK647_09430, partial [Gemmatimonadales bacterium]|nr:hypothetical protein [Gemmatimonadales bacterium]
MAGGRATRPPHHGGCGREAGGRAQLCCEGRELGGEGVRYATTDQAPKQTLLAGAGHPRERQQAARRRSWATRGRAVIAPDGQVVE